MQTDRHYKPEDFRVAGHAKALTSTDASDILLPGIETRKTCFECHSYHYWSKHKEITPKFTLPTLPAGSR